MINFSRIQEKIKDLKEIAIYSSEEYSNLIQSTHDHIKTLYPDIDIYLLNGKNILCPLKTQEFDFYVLLGVPCPVHAFKNFIAVESHLSDEDVENLKTKKNVIYDGTYKLLMEEEMELDKKTDIVVVTKNQAFYDYVFYKYDVSSYFNLIQRDKMMHLSSKINKGEKIKLLNIFAVIFTSKLYEDLSKKIKNALVSRGKNAYLLFLKDISYERLITIEGVECIVIVDCPLFDFSHIDLHLPIVTPFEVEYALSNRWNGEFIKNSFNISLKDSKTLAISESRAGKLLLANKSEVVPFEKEDEDDMEIYEGQSGIAQKYKDETK